MRRVLTPAQRAAQARQYIAEFSAPLPALAKEEIRDGLLGSNGGCIKRDPNRGDPNPKESLPWAKC
jgi:hypothetical protein